MIFSTSKEVKTDLIPSFLLPIFFVRLSYEFFYLSNFRGAICALSQKFFVRVCQNFVRPANFHLRQISIVLQIPGAVKF
jgi:hypothetical protein